MGFLKKGKASQKQVAAAEKKAEEQAEGYIRRFWLPNDAETTITFLDGKLLPDGLLDNTTFLEHQLNLNGSWQNWYACTSEDEPCPICEGGDTPSLVGVFTIIDHSEWTSKKDGSKHKDEKRLFVAKRHTLKQLQKIATKRKGLTGITFDVSRIGEKAASVGDMFDFVQKKPLSFFQKKYKDAEAYDYEEILTYKDAQELREEGFGSLSVGNEPEVDEDEEGEYEDDV